MSTRRVTLGRYELLARLASGGMGEIHLARLTGQGGFAKLVVLKRLLPELVPSEQFVSMFLDEARLVARLSHPNVCEVHDLGVVDGQYFIVMQYLEGVPFSRVMTPEPGEDRPGQLRAVGSLLVQAGEGLHHAHEARDDDGRPLGVVHRDVSPSNLFVTADGVLKVLDFGIAKARGAESVTEKGMLKGKLAYMSPEQVAEAPLDRRSDVFCLGIVLWEALAGGRLFKRESPILAAKAVVEEPIPALPGDVPPELAAVATRALEREPAARFPTARELGAALAAALAPLGGAMTTAELAEVVRRRFAADLERQRAQYRSSAELAGLPPEEPTTPRAAPTTSVERPEPTAPWIPPRRRAPASRALLAAAVVAAGAVALIVASRRADAPRPAPPAAATAPPLPDAGVAVAPPATPIDAGPRPRPPVPRAARGYLSIDSTPYAVVYLDGRKLGETPIIRREVPAGKHTLRAVLQDGRERRIPVEIPAGGDAPPIQLSW